MKITKILKGILYASAMLIPGLGGSLMMYVFGIYVIYIEAVATLNVVILSVLVAGMILGVLAGIVLTKKLLKSFTQELYCAALTFWLSKKDSTINA